MVIKKWSKEVFGINNVVMENLHSEVDGLTAELKSDGTNDEVAYQIKDVTGKLNIIMVNEELLWQQKFRVKWLKAGDRNISFFLAVARIKQDKNVISAAENDQGVVLTNQDNIKDFIVKFYRTKFAFKEIQIDDSLVDLIPKMIQDADNEMLTAIPNDDEIRSVVLGMDPDSSPGLDGISGCFYTKCWEVVGQSVCNPVKFYFVDSVLTKGLNSCFIVLLPKERGKTIHNNVGQASEMMNVLDKRRFVANLIELSFSLLRDGILNNLLEFLTTYVYGGEARLLSTEKGAKIEGKASLLAALDYYVSMQSGIFISASPRNRHSSLAYSASQMMQMIILLITGTNKDGGYFALIEERKLQ
ncbi:hypothetical protein GIB67_021375 [Kingdonia uniflora]|uniref:Uncharacterized protein n=1 Tax=Kingdonia uniflora TaxID=39325 RepID=A0A7J7MCU6_9MAGN|nr:hypothetical protein GIB67_021375 [Kingdonia uniflora]